MKLDRLGFSVGQPNRGTCRTFPRCRNSRVGTVDPFLPPQSMSRKESRGLRRSNGSASTTRGSSSAVKWKNSLDQRESATTSVLPRRSTTRLASRSARRIACCCRMFCALCQQPWYAPVIAPLAVRATPLASTQPEGRCATKLPPSASLTYSSALARGTSMRGSRTAGEPGGDGDVWRPSCALRGADETARRGACAARPRRGRGGPHCSRRCIGPFFTWSRSLIVANSIGAVPVIAVAIIQR